MDGLRGTIPPSRPAPPGLVLQERLLEYAAAGVTRALAAGLLLAVEQGRFGPASRLAGRTRRRMDIILAVETRMGDQVRGLARAIGSDAALNHTTRAVGAAMRASAF